jgi:predicted DNA-binding protein (MmcQ/YjbR family)
LSLEDFRKYCVSKKGVSEEFPFDENTIVFKVVGKIFALADVDEFSGINLKCNPAISVELQERYPAVTPGYHMNKNHWITVAMDHSIPDKVIFTWIDRSYELVVDKLTKMEKILLQSM